MLIESGNVKEIVGAKLYIPEDPISYESLKRFKFYHKIMRIFKNK